MTEDCIILFFLVLSQAFLTWVHLCHAPEELKETKKIVYSKKAPPPVSVVTSSRLKPRNDGRAPYYKTRFGRNCYKSKLKGAVQS